MKIAIIYSTINKSTKKSCKILESKIKSDTQLIPIEMAKNECVLKYNFIILAGSALNGRVQGSLKRYISQNIKTLKEKPLGLIINCEKDHDRLNKTFTEELVNTSYINSNFGYELSPDEGNIIEKKITNKIINNYKKNNKELPSIDTKEIDNFACKLNDLIEKRVD